MKHSPHASTSKPQLAVVIQGFDLTGGVSTSCRNQISILSRAYDITVITDLNIKAEEEPPTTFEIVRLSVPSFKLLRRFGHVPRQLAFIQQAKKYLLQASHERRFDAVIFHSHPAAALMATFLRKRGIRSILVVHGDIFERPEGTYGRQLNSWYRWATPRAYRRVDSIISLSPAMQNHAKRWASDKTLHYIVPNSIDPNEIGIIASLNDRQSQLMAPPPSRAGSCDYPHRIDTIDANHHAESNPELLFVGRIEPVKGVANLLQAVAQLHKLRRRVTLLCVGSMNTSYERELKSLIKELELEEAVRFSPPVPRTSLGELYRSCSVLVVPSLSEPQGLVVLEGMAAGCAIVASDTGGIGMMLDHGKSGLLFPASDVAALSRCLQQLLMDSDARQVLGATANRRFKTKFSREALAPHLLEAIAGTLRSTPIAAR